MEIGIFSGSFNPIHTGHAIVANYLAQFCGLDEVWLMPSPVNPLKVGTPPIPEAPRLEMCDIVARKCTNVKVSDFETNLPLPSYTYRTLKALKDSYPGHTFHLVIGSDNWLAFDKWKNHKKIIAEFPIIIYPRPGYEIKESLPEGIRLLGEAPQALISSTFIREALKSDKNMNFFLDPEVNEYIKKHKLYE